jgi:hypothetical protein
MTFEQRVALMKPQTRKSRPATVYSSHDCSANRKLLLKSDNVPSSYLILVQKWASRGRYCTVKNRDTVLFVVFSLLLTLSAWGREDRLINTGATPAAMGKVITDNDRNGNTIVKVEVKHMASPESLSPPKNSYVVWIQARGKEPEILGVLRVNSDLEGSLKATTPYKDFDIFITAEDNPKPDLPSNMTTLKGTVERH